MANFKSIADVPVTESAEGLNLIVNDGGSAKQIPASQVGAQADWSVTDETSPAFVKNKPAVSQADWNVTDETSPAFIKNKPAGGYLVEANADNAMMDGQSLLIKIDATELVNAVESGSHIHIAMSPDLSGAPFMVYYFPMMSYVMQADDGSALVMLGVFDGSYMFEITIGSSVQLGLG